jgi:hypothetical protein
VSRPQVVGGRSSIRFRIDPLRDGAHGCPLTVDLYRTDSLIDAVVVYTPRGR